MKAMHVSIRQIGNSQGVVIPKPFLAQLGLNGEAGAETTIESGDDALVMGEFGNAVDAELAS